MIKSIFVPLLGLPRDAQLLNAAIGLARLFDGHVECLHVRPNPQMLIATTVSGMETGYGAGVFPAELWTVLVEADQQRAKAARTLFEASCKHHGIAIDKEGATGISAHYREMEGNPAREITSAARFNDLVVLSHRPIVSEASWDATGEVIVGCGRPILLAPSVPLAGSFKTVTVAWKETAEAARAVTAAMPIFAKAEAVVVLSAREGSHRPEEAIRSAERLATLFRRHGFNARSEHVPAETSTPPEAVVGRAVALKSSLLVMGAYGHSRMREFVMGGFTRHVLNGTQLPVLIAH